MIQHEIAIYKVEDFSPVLKTVNRDLLNHREGGLPAWRDWHPNGVLYSEFYYRNGLQHREGDLPAWRWWFENGNLRLEKFYHLGKIHREGGLPAVRVWFKTGLFATGFYYLHGEKYDPT